MSSIDQRWVGVMIGCPVGFFVSSDLGLLLGGFVGAFQLNGYYRIVGAVMSWLCAIVVGIVVGIGCGFGFALMMLLSGRVGEFVEKAQQCSGKAGDEMVECYGFGNFVLVAPFLIRVGTLVGGPYFGATLACRWSGVSPVQQRSSPLAIQCGGNLNKTESATGRTALHIAAQSGNVDAVKSLLAAGALVDQPDNQDCTPLHLAAQTGSLAIVQALLNAGCNVTHRAADGTTAHDRALHYGHAHIAQYLLRQPQTI